MTDNTREQHRETPFQRSALLRTTFLVEGGLLLAAIALGFLLGVPFWQSAHFSVSDAVVGVLAGLTMLAGAAAITESSLPFAVQMRRDIDRLIHLFRGATWPDLLWISLLAGAGEEALFRGLLQTWLADSLGLPTAILVASLIFGLAHFISRAYVFFAAMLGVLFGTLYAWSGNIIVPMVAHTAYDFVALLLAVRAARQSPER